MTYDDAKKALEVKRGALKEHNAEFSTFKKENKLGDKVPTDAKLKATYGTFIETQKRLQGETEAAEKVAKELKPAREGAFATKYTYPLVEGKEMTKEEKKKFRTAARRAANKPEGDVNKATKKAEGKEKVETAKVETKPLIKKVIIKKKED